MNIFVLISFLIIVYSLYNYKNAFIIYIGFRLFLNLNIHFDLPGLPLLTLDFFTTSAIVLIFFLNKSKIKYDKTEFPLKKAFIIFILVDFITAVFSIGGFLKSFPPSLVHIVDMIYVYILWTMLKKDSIKLILYELAIITTIICLYCIVEKFLEYNPLKIYEISLAGNRKTEWLYENDIRGYRTSSIFIHPIGAGANFAFLSVLLFYSSVFVVRNIKSYIFIFISALCVLCCVYCNSRGPLLYFIAVIPFVIMFHNSGRWLKFISIVLILFFISIPYLSEYNEMIFSIFDLKGNSDFTGSNFQMRVSQYEAAWRIFIDYPITGLGTRGYEYYPVLSIRQRLLGLESVWMSLMVTKGVLGLIAYSYVFITILKIRVSRLKWRVLLFITLGYLAVNTATSLPGAFSYLYYLTIFFIIKSGKGLPQKFIDSFGNRERVRSSTIC